MKIELNVHPYHNCARIFAFAENNEPGYFFKGTQIFEVFIWHTDMKPGLRRLNEKSETYENDCVLNFHSKHPFADFCGTFAASTFNSPAHYNLHTHNCAFAANYALKIAGIDLNIGAIIMTNPSINLGRFFRLPTPFLTPVDLYRKAKEFKIHQNQRFLQESPFKALKLIRAAENLRHSPLTGICKEISEQAVVASEAHPHRAEQYDNLLNECINKITKEVHTSSFLSISMFQHRREKPSDPLYENILCSIGLFVAFYSGLSMSPELNPTYSNADLQNYCCVLFALALACLTGDFYVKNHYYQKESKIVDTPLSTSIKAFNQHMFLHDNKATASSSSIQSSPDVDPLIM